MGSADVSPLVDLTILRARDEEVSILIKSDVQGVFNSVADG